jgi:hypothetical protein
LGRKRGFQGNVKSGTVLASPRGKSEPMTEYDYFQI